MSLIDIAKAIATNVSIEVPTAVLSNLTNDNVKIIQFTVSAAEEIARRVDWASLRATQTITGTGSNDDFTLDTGFSRLISGYAIKASGSPVRVGLSPDEWNSLTPTEGTPRFARLLGGSIAFYPYLAESETATVTYQSKNWCENGTTWGSDSDVALIPEVLIQQGAIWRWRRHLSQDFQDHLAEFESALAEYAKFDDGIRSP